MKKIQASPKKIEYENPRDIQLFSKIVQHCWRVNQHPKLTFQSMSLG